MNAIANIQTMNPSAQSGNCALDNTACISPTLDSICFEQAQENTGFFINKVAQQLVALIGGPKAFCNLPELKYDKSFSSSDYIDSIKADNVTDPVMIGIDLSNRLFLTFKTQLVREEENTSLELIPAPKSEDSKGFLGEGLMSRLTALFQSSTEPDTKEVSNPKGMPVEVSTLFQRYTNPNNSPWATGGGRLGPLALVGSPCKGESSNPNTCIGVLNTLFNEGKVNAPTSRSLDDNDEIYKYTTHKLV